MGPDLDILRWVDPGPAGQIDDRMHVADIHLNIARQRNCPLITQSAPICRLHWLLRSAIRPPVRRAPGPITR
jgi:hypothetical protein